MDKIFFLFSPEFCLCIALLNEHEPWNHSLEKKNETVYNVLGSSSFIQFTYILKKSNIFVCSCEQMFQSNGEFIEWSKKNKKQIYRHGFKIGIREALLACVAIKLYILTQHQCLVSFDWIWKKNWERKRVIPLEIDYVWSQSVIFRSVEEEILSLAWIIFGEKFSWIEFFDISKRFWTTEFGESFNFKRFNFCAYVLF